VCTSSAQPNGSDADEVAVVLLLAALVILAILTFRDYAISNDEEVQHRYGELILAYYGSGFTDRSVFGFKNLYLYGGLFDIVAVLLGKLLPFDVWTMRHLLCALIGIGGIAATWATARLVAGSRAALVALLALATCGPWYGAMFNHTKDIPFAAAMMGATYFLLRAARDLPRPRWSDLWGFGILLGAACGLRAMGLLLIGYAGLAVLVWLPGASSGDWRVAARLAGTAALRFLPPVVLGYAIMVACWPWAALEPLNPVRAIFDFAHFHYPIRTIFDDHIYEMADVPRWYVVAYLLIRMPVLMLAAGIGTMLFACWPRAWRDVKDSRMHGEVGLLAFTVLFPLLCQYVGHGPAFTGMRHFFFVVPPLAALAGIGIDRAWIWLATRWRGLAAGAVAAVAAFFLWQTSILVRLHPDEYLFYNVFVGGLPGAAGHYAMDYWVNMMPEAVSDLKGYLSHTDAGPRTKRRYRVAVCGEWLPFEDAAAGSQLEPTDNWDKADFFIAPTHMHCDRADNGKVVAKVMRLGVVIGVVKDRRSLLAPDVARAH
jgi:hypothetical protein